MAKNKPSKPPSYAQVLQSLKEGFKNTEARDVIQLLEQQARDAVIEVMTGYLATPDALRELVKEEFVRRIGDDYIVSRYRGALENHEVPQAALEKAKELAEEHMSTPEYQAQILEVAKNEYIRSYTESMNRYIKDHAWRDAHSAYQRAFRAPPRRQTPSARKNKTRGE
jgi:hypothetical protein